MVAAAAPACQVALLIETTHYSYCKLSAITLAQPRRK